VTDPKSGQAKARELVAQFQAYLDGLSSRGEPLPQKANGELHVTRVARDSGIGSRERFYTNPTLQEMLRRASSSLPKPVQEPRSAASPSPSSDTVRRAQRALEARLNRLEQQNAVLMAENSELRRRVAELSARLGRDEHMYATGRRVAEPPPP
jgi:hypothetical protein